MSFSDEVCTKLALSVVENIELGSGSIIRTVDGGAISVGPNSFVLEMLEKARLSRGVYRIVCVVNVH